MPHLSVENFFLLQVVFQKQDWSVHKGSLGEMASNTVDGEVGVVEEEGVEVEELFSWKPIPLWATFDPNEVLLDSTPQLGVFQQFIHII